jgi:hypothetical protein
LASIATVGVYGWTLEQRCFASNVIREASHRSLIAERLEAEFGAAVVDLRP